MKVKMSLISKDVKVEKICYSKREIEVFKRDMPAKYDLLFSKKAYAIGTMVIK